MKRTKTHALLSLLLAIPSALVMTGCGGAGSGAPTAPSIILQTVYGNGPQGQGMTLNDDGVNLFAQSLDSCAEGTTYAPWTVSGTTGSSTSLAPATFSFTPPSNCNNNIDLLVYRQASTDCSYSNTIMPNGSPAWGYNENLFTASDQPYELPCSSDSVTAALVPRMIAHETPPSSMTMTSSAGTFHSTYGMPKVTIYSSTGSVLGTVTATSVASDGSSIAFSPSMLSTYNSYETAGVIATTFGSSGSSTTGGAALLYIQPPPAPPPVNPCGAVAVSGKTPKVNPNMRCTNL